MALKTEHFTTPIKLILPGIIVSLIGLTASNVIFNDPVKIRGRNSRTAWDNLMRYEKIYEDNTAELTCIYNQGIGTSYFKDMIHLQEMTVENLKKLGDDKDIDKLVAAIINLRIDTYTQLKNITTGFIDSLTILASKRYFPFDTAGINQNISDQTALQKEYIAEKTHISVRDTSIIKKLGGELQKNYKAFTNVKFIGSPIMSIDTIQQRAIGTWSEVSNETSKVFTIKKDKTGILNLDKVSHNFTWKFDDVDRLKFTMSFIDKFEPDWVFDLERCTDKLLQYKSSKSGEITLVACRMTEQ